MVGAAAGRRGVADGVGTNAVRLADGAVNEGAAFLSERAAVMFLPALAVAALIAIAVLATLLLERGHFTFPLDDPYIHLALAKNILSGHYGINAGEFAAPSSSLLWPFVLAPFAGTPFAVAVPVIFNTCCASCTVMLFAGVAYDVLHVNAPSRKRSLVIGLSILFAVGTNQIGLALLGMEHSAQVLCAVWLATSVVRQARGGLRPPSCFAIGCAIALGPMLRYEMVGTSVLACGYFMVHRRGTCAAVGLLIALAALAAFSIVLVSHGLGPLPTSVIAKYGATEGRSLISTVVANLRMQLHAGWAVIFAFFGFGYLFLREHHAMPRTDRILAAFMMLVLLAHMLVGRSGWFGRYEAYALAFAYVTALGVFARPLSEFATKPPPVRALVLLGGFASLLSIRYAALMVTTPLGALNVYEQQAQVARFVADYYRKPVAVNDLGYVAWRSPSYVLDLVGLASNEALRARRLHESDTGAWASGLAGGHGVHFAAIYDAWFPKLPSSWVACGRLHLGSKRWTAALDTVTFYALDDTERAVLKPELAEWAASLPMSTHFDFAAGCR